jgi:RNA polymerase sigma factor (sigma-70 family)
VTALPIEPSADFATVYERYAADVFRFGFYLSGNRPDAEDITSETFVRAFVAFVRAFVAPERIKATTVKANLLTIARNLFLDGLRRRSRQSPLPDDVADPGPAASHRLEQESELQAVIATLQTLAEIDRAALLMRAVDGLPYEEIANTLGISLSLAKLTTVISFEGGRLHYRLLILEYPQIFGPCVGLAASGWPHYYFFVLRKLRFRKR